MILDQIILHDFGVYAGLQKIDLAVPDISKPIILFGGLNGTGKTTVLDALQLCLYGPAAQCAGRSHGNYHEYLIRAVNKRSRWKQASVGLVFRRTVDGTEIRYRVIRSWKVSGARVKETLDVTRDKRPDPTIAKNWASHVEEIMPINIAHLFFFDGEKVEAYASPSSARNLVATAVYGLLGLDVVERLQQDLQILERRQQAKKLPAAQKESIAQLDKELAEIRLQIKKYSEDNAELLSRKIGPAKRNLLMAEKEYIDRGGALREQREQIESRLMDADVKIATSIEKMKDVASGQLPLALVADLLRDLSSHARKSVAQKSNALLTKELRRRDVEILKFARKTFRMEDGLCALEEFLHADLEKRCPTAEYVIPVNLVANESVALHTFLNDTLPHLTNVAKNTIEEQSQFEADAESIRFEKASIPSDDEIDTIQKKRDELRAAVARLEENYQLLDDKIKSLKHTEENRKSALTTLWEKHIDAEIAQKDSDRFLQYSRNARQTVAQFKRAVMLRQIRRVEQLVLESYQSLLRKDTLVTGLSIDPKSFDIVLVDADKQQIVPEQLSAGERQLLAVSLLWGMAKASGKVLPMAIDTPLGRLDSIHRTRLIKRYFGFASHQVLLFSTDQEISGEYLQQLAPWIGLHYKLDHDDTIGNTVITTEHDSFS